MRSREGGGTAAGRVNRSYARRPGAAGPAWCWTPAAAAKSAGTWRDKPATRGTAASFTGSAGLGCGAWRTLGRQNQEEEERRMKRRRCVCVSSRTQCVAVMEPHTLTCVSSGRPPSPDPNSRPRGRDPARQVTARSQLSTRLSICISATLCVYLSVDYLCHVKIQCFLNM